MLRKHHQPFKTRILLSGFFCALFLASCTSPPTVCIQTHCFEVEIAQTPAERQQGLMFRRTLEKDKGMLFLFEPATTPSFWMKNTLIPLSIVWISPEKRIVHMVHHAKPHDLTPLSPKKIAPYVLEIRAPLSETYEFNIGDSVTFKHIPSLPL